MIYGDRKTKTPDVNAIVQSNNLYAYCMNNPVNFVDTSGEIANWVRQHTIWLRGVDVLKIAGLNLSAQMLKHSIRWFYATDVDITESGTSGSDRISGATVIEALKHSSTINNKIDALIAEKNKSGETSFLWDKNNILAINDTTDLYLSFNNATVTLKGTKNENGSWRVNVNVFDIYDFDVESYSNINSFKTFIG